MIVVDPRDEDKDEEEEGVSFDIDTDEEEKEDVEIEVEELQDEEELDQKEVTMHLRPVIHESLPVIDPLSLADSKAEIVSIRRLQPSMRGSNGAEIVTLKGDCSEIV